MKKFIHQIADGKDFKINLLLIFAIFAFVGFGCSGGSKTSAPLPAAYYGDWKGSDGSTLTIRSNNSGDFRSGNFKVENGTVAIDDAKKELSVTFVGIGKTLKIDQEPSGNQMKLGGVTYSKDGGSTIPLSDKSGDTSKTSSSGDMPSDAELKILVQKSLQDFTKAVDKNDFKDFLETTSEAFQNENSEDKVKSVFDVFIRQKDKFVPILQSTSSVSPSFSPAPSISSGVLTANGSYSVKQLVTFELSYVKEEGEWKIQSIRVKL